MLTIFAIPKPFLGEIDTIQRNAIQSWMKLHPTCQIMLFGNEVGTSEAATEFGLKHISEISHNEYGTPLVNSIFELAKQHSNHKIMCYVNSDIILTSNFLEALKRNNDNENYLMVGQRWDLDISEKVDFENQGWEDKLWDRVINNGVLHVLTGMDYFVFPKDLFKSFPPFAIGRPVWDNWMLYQARVLGASIIDSSLVITAIHQNHKPAYSSSGQEAKNNGKLAVDTGMSYLYTLLDATHTLTPFNLEHRQIRDPLHWQADVKILGKYRLILNELFQEFALSSNINLVYKHIIASSYWYQANLEILDHRIWASLPNIWRAHKLKPEAYPWSRVLGRAWIEAREILSRVIYQRMLV